MGLRNFVTLNEYLDELRGNPREVPTLMRRPDDQRHGVFSGRRGVERPCETGGWPSGRGAWIRRFDPDLGSCMLHRRGGLFHGHADDGPGGGGGEAVRSQGVCDRRAGRQSAQGAGWRVSGRCCDRLSARAPSHFFQKLDGSFQVSKELRDIVVFAQQNLLRDPPFSRLDVISCRNCLIYLNPRRSSASLPCVISVCGRAAICFSAMPKPSGGTMICSRPYPRNGGYIVASGPTRHDLIDYPSARDRGRARAEADDPPSQLVEPVAASVAETARRALLERYAPASVLIDRKGRVLYFHGTTRDYLEQPPGEPTRDLLTMVRDGLALKLRGAIREASNGTGSVTVSARIRQGRAARTVAVTVMPVSSASRDGGFLLVSFAPVSVRIRQAPGEGRCPRGPCRGVVRRAGASR